MATLARGQPARSTPEVRLHVAAAAPVVVAVGDRLRARLGELGVALTLDAVDTVDVARVLSDGGASTPSSADDTAIADVWLDGRAFSEATLVLVPRVGDRALARRLALPSGVDEVALAELAFIVDRAVLALLAAEEVGVPKEEARAALEEAPPPAPAGVARARASRRPAGRAEEPSLFLHVGLMATAQAWSESDPVLPAFGLVAGLERGDVRGRQGIGLAGSLRGGVSASTADARVAVSGGDAHLWLTFARAFAGAGLGRLSLGPGLYLDHADVTPAAGAPHTVRPETRTDVTLALGGSVRFDVELLSHLVFFASAGVDVLPWPIRYTAIVDGTSTTLLQPWPIRLSLAFGVALDKH